MKPHRFPSLRSALVHGVIAFLALTSFSLAIEIRGYDKDVHKWLEDFPGEWLYGHPPRLNPKFKTIDPAKLLGVGWPEDGKEWTRQCALVSPIHILYATHHKFDPRWKINFLGKDGKVTRHAIASQTPVTNSKGEKTDLLLVKLATPVPDATIYKVLWLDREEDYLHKPLVVCGSFVDVGISRIDGFLALPHEPGLNTTWFLHFDYYGKSTDDPARNCAIKPGDSGGPVFVRMENGDLALVGIISGYDPLPNNGDRSYASSIPTYFRQIDALMEKDGYRLTSCR
ncbi:MAG: hypothetical protein QM627_11520 [Luteolibacter sp.]